MSHNAVGANGNIISDFYCANDLCTRPDIHIISERWIACIFSAIRLPKRYTLRNMQFLPIVLR